jgi:phage terminase large subunit GpA-like protein
MIATPSKFSLTFDAASPLGLRASHQELSHFLRAAIAPELRGMRRFATEEIVIPEGRFEGQKLRIERQPYTGLLFDEIDSGRWHRFAFTGPVQSGKTLNASVIPVCYHLFERRETIVFGIPSMDMAGDKWRLELLPVIQRSRYRNLIPDHGLGSRGGQFESITFKNGATLKFISGGGGDEKRSGFTTRVLIITEADKLDETSESSREADKVTQLEARTLSNDWGQAVTYMECTTSIEEGRIWQEYQRGSASRIFCPCPGCKTYVHPTRECLQGWQEAADEIEAQALAHWACPECGQRWTDADRVAMNLACRLVHKGQSIDPDGVISGDLPRTKTLGFRWDAFNNLFWTTGTIGAREWRASHDLRDLENAERELRQFWWALPALPPGSDVLPLTEGGLLDRVAKNRPRGVAPAWTDLITVGVDLGKFLAHWTAIAWKLDGTSHVLDYGRFEVPTDHMGVENAIYNALSEFADTIRAGWQIAVTPARQVVIDARYNGKTVYAFIDKMSKSGQKGVFRASLGYGASEEKFKTYRPAKHVSANVRFVGDGYHIAWLEDVRQQVAEVNGDQWKSFLHGRLTTPLDMPGAMTIFAAMPSEHLAFFKHLTAEKETHEFVVDKGFVTRWVRKHRKNHWLDSTYMNGPAAHWCGVRVVGPTGPPHAAIPTVAGWFANRQKRN